MALAVAGTALVVLQRQQLVDGLTSLAREQAQEIASQVADEGIDDVDVDAVSATAGERALIQVVAPDRTVVTGTAAVHGEPPVTAAAPSPGRTVVEVLQELPVGDDEPYVVVTLGVATDEGAARVIAAQSLDTVQRSTTVVLTLLGIGYPLIVLVVGGTSYWLAGRALAPVEAIRRRVGEVSADDLAARVPVPESGDEIARLAETMNTMLGRLQASAEAQRRFVADASHELRSPLATIRAATELAGSHPDAMDRDSAAEAVLAETYRLERLVADLLLLARSDEKGLVMRVADVDLDDILTAEASRLRRTGGLDIVVDIRSVRVRGDLEHLVRAIRNLTDNAARYATTTVGLRLRAEGGRAVLQVVDDGPGIPAQEREHVLERFVRLDSSRERGTGGTGLGLAIVSRIAHEHGGSLRVGEAQGGGAALELSLPLPVEEVTDGRS